MIHSRGEIFGLFELAKQKDIGAMNTLSDAAADIMGYYWFSNVHDNQRMGDGAEFWCKKSTPSDGRGVLWAYPSDRKRHAPLVDLTSASKIPMPKRYVMDIYVDEESGLITISRVVNNEVDELKDFDYDSNEQEALARTCATLYAYASEREE